MTSSQGTIKSFSAKNGYGFITDGAGTFDTDIFFGKEALPSEWHDGKLEGMEVVYNCSLNDNGKPVATNISPVNTPDVGERITGVVKSWKKSTGFGFLTAAGVDGDIFFAHDRLPDTLRNEEKLENLTFLFELKMTEDGKPQARNMMLQGHPDVLSRGTRRAAPGLGSGDSGNLNKRQFQTSSTFQGDEAPSKRRNMGNQVNNSGNQDKKIVGTVKSFSDKTGYGFIVSDQHSSDIVVYDKDIQGGKVNKEDVVQFELRFSKSGSPQAINVQVLNKGDGNGIPNRSVRPVVRGNPTPRTDTGECPNLTVQDLKLYVDQLDTKDLGELATYTTQALHAKLEFLY